MNGVFPAPEPAATCWDQELFIRAGYTPGYLCQATFGVPRSIHSVVWHCMEGRFPGAIERWNTGAAGAHLCVLESGLVVLTCRLEDIAWHAGTHGVCGRDGYGRTEFWRTHNINPYSIGVEVEGYVVRGFTPEQAAACRRIADWLTQQYGIKREHTFDEIDGHHAHGELSSSRTDPGVYFDWNWVL